MDEDSFWFFVIISSVIGCIIWGFVRIQTLEKQVSDCSDKINSANSQILILNDSIENAKDEAWSEYDSMGYVLDNLETGFQVSNPCIPDKNTN